MTAFEIRKALVDDLPFLRGILVEAAYWRSSKAPANIEAALNRPDLCYLLTDWGRPGDAGSIAHSGGTPLGAAWYRFWTEARHSYGFVDESTPEIAIGVLPTHRGKGIGTALLLRLLESAFSAGIRQLSLSVEPDNPALRLYQRLGFEHREGVGAAHTMVL